jgi:hypothetical protein
MVLLHGFYLHQNRFLNQQSSFLGMTRAESQSTQSKIIQNRRLIQAGFQ